METVESNEKAETGPTVDDARIAAMYSLISDMTVELDADPLELGPKRLNGKIEECRRHLSRCEKLFLEVSQDLHWYKRRQRFAVADYSLKLQGLLANDPDVRAGKSVTDREAIATMKLRAEQEELDRLSFCVEDLDAVIVVIRTKRSDLRDIQARLKDQRQVCQEEINLGSKWGKSSLKPQASSSKDSIEEMFEALEAKVQAKDLIGEDRASDEVLDQIEVIGVEATIISGESNVEPQSIGGNNKMTTDDNIDDILAQF